VKAARLVVAGLIEREGRLLVCRRRADDAYGLKWEFPGGKAEGEESPQAALRRELAEELGLEAEIGEELARYGYQYPGREPILLIFYRVRAWKGEPQNRAFAEIRWESPERLGQYDFLEGDREFLRRLAGGAPGLPGC